MDKKIIEIITDIRVALGLTVGSPCFANNPIPAFSIVDFFEKIFEKEKLPENND